MNPSNSNFQAALAEVARMSQRYPTAHGSWLSLSETFEVARSHGLITDETPQAERLEIVTTLRQAFVAAIAERLATTASA